MTPSSSKDIRSASHPSTNDRAAELIASRLTAGSRLIELGAGRGHLARRVYDLLRERGGADASLLATDVNTGQFEAEEVPFQAVDFNRPLPFEDSSFDLAYSIEVVEHLHRPYDFLRECARVLRPGGWLVLTTPNLLNLESRLRFFFTGFGDLYEPPSTSLENAGRLCGHVMPLHYAYHAYGLRLAGFGDMRLVVDRAKKGSRALYYGLYPLLALARHRFMKQARNYDAEVFAENQEVLRAINGADLMTARSLIIEARKATA